MPCDWGCPSKVTSVRVHPSEKMSDSLSRYYIRNLQYLLLLNFFFFLKKKKKKIQVSKLNSGIHLEAELEVQWFVYPDFTNRSSDILSLFGGTGGGQQTAARRPACKFRILELPEPVCTWSASSKWGDTSPCGIST